MTPYGWPKGGFPDRPQGPYYCSIGTENAYGRAVCEAHYKCCMYAGINISGINGEVMPGQWEYQVGPCTGIDSPDQLIISRYLLIRVCEQFGVVVSFDPKPIPGDWNGAGCHTNVSTNEMRAPGGYDKILVAMERLGAPGKQDEHIKAYDISGGEDNKRRLTGAHETAPITKFSYGVANRGCSVRIPRMTEKEKCGYFEDRRPASNMDPYVVTGKIMEINGFNETEVIEPHPFGSGESLPHFSPSPAMHSIPLTLRRRRRSPPNVQTEAEIHGDAHAFASALLQDGHRRPLAFTR